MKKNNDNDELEDFYMQVSCNIKKIRKAKKISQLTLAVELGHSSAAFIARAENLANGKHFNLEHIFWIAKYFDVNICDLLVENNEV